MADNLTTQTAALSTVPDASVVATDDVGGAHYQRMKLADGTDGSSTMAKVTSEGSLQAITPNRTATGTLDAAEEAVTIACDGATSLTGLVTASDLDGTIHFEWTVDGTNWQGAAGLYWSSQGTFIASWDDPIAGEYFSVVLPAVHSFRVRCSTRTSGAVTLTLTAGVGPANPDLSNVVQLWDGTAGATISAGSGTVNNALRVTVASNSDPLSVDDNGGSLTVDGTVAVTGVATAANQLPDGHNVTVDNGAGGAAVNIQDGGNAITVDGTVAVTGVATAANQATEITALQKIDDPVQVLGTDTYSEATSSGMTLGAVRRDADTTLVGTTNEFSPLQVDANGRLKVEAFSGETLPVSGTVSVTEPVSIDDNGGNISIDFAGTVPPIGAGTEAAALRVTVATDSTGVLSVDDNGGVLTVDGTVTANQGTAGTAWEVVGDVAASVAAPANPVVVGAQMETMADSAPATRADADGDAVKFATTDGALFVIPTGAQIFTSHNTGVETGTQIHAAPGSGLSCYITAISFSIGAATASSVTVLNNGGADIWGPHYLEAISGRGLHVTFPTPLKGTANTRIDVTTTGAATQTVDIQGFIAPG